MMRINDHFAHRIVRPPTRRGTQHTGIALALGFGALALGFDYACERFKRCGMKRSEALSDGAAHIATALACAIPASPFVDHRGRFIAIAAASAVAIDLDHVVAARSTSLIPCMTMPHRPASHSVLTVSAVTYAAERLWPGTPTGLALSIGLGSHLLRDLATGGAPLFLPKRIVAIQRPPVASMMVALGVFGRWFARRRLEPGVARRSNPSVLAPEAIVVGSRVLRAMRDQRAELAGRRVA